MNKFVKGVLFSTIISITVLIGNYNMYAEQNLEFFDTNKEEDSYDVSTGWKVMEYNSSSGIDYHKFLLQGHVNPEGTQKMVTAHFYNIGKTIFTAKKTISMKKGVTYNVNLIYAMYYSADGGGYIDFNGDKKYSDNDSQDKEYVQKITPDEDMKYDIVVHFEVSDNITANGYFKLGFNPEQGGVSPELTELAPPQVTKNPEAGSNEIEGTADPGNTIVIKDSEGKEIGQEKVQDSGRFKALLQRNLLYKENIYITQTKGSVVSESLEITVVDTIPPEKPIIEKVTDEDDEINGTAEPGSIIKMFVNRNTDYYYHTTVDENGKFLMKLNSRFEAGTHLSFEAIDEAANTSESNEINVEYAKSLDFTYISEITSRDNQIRGKATRKDCFVEVIFNSGVTFTGTTDNTGSFLIPIKQVQLVGTAYKIKLRHLTSNEVKEVSKRVLPIPPTIPAINAGQSVVSGISEPNAELLFTLMRDGESYNFKTTAEADGKFDLSLIDENDKVIYLQVGDVLKGKACLNVEDDLLESLELIYQVFTFFNVQL